MSETININIPDTLLSKAEEYFQNANNDVINKKNVAALTKGLNYIFSKRIVSVFLNIYGLYYIKYEDVSIAPLIYLALFLILWPLVKIIFRQVNEFCCPRKPPPSK